MQSWAEQRGVNPMVPGVGVAAVLGTAARKELRDRLLRRFGRNLTTLGPLLTGAAVAGYLNRRATLSVGEQVREDLRQHARPTIGAAARPEAHAGQPAVASAGGQHRRRQLGRAPAADHPVRGRVGRVVEQHLHRAADPGPLDDERAAVGTDAEQFPLAGRVERDRVGDEAHRQPGVVHPQLAVRSTATPDPAQPPQPGDRQRQQHRERQPRSQRRVRRGRSRRRAARPARRRPATTTTARSAARRTRCRAVRGRAECADATLGEGTARVGGRDTAGWRGAAPSPGGNARDDASDVTPSE